MREMQTAFGPEVDRRPPDQPHRRWPGFALILACWTVLALIRTPSTILSNGFDAHSVQGWEYGFGAAFMMLVPWMLATPLILTLVSRYPFQGRTWDHRLPLHVLFAIPIIALVSAAGTVLSRPFTGYRPLEFRWWLAKGTLVAGAYAVTSYAAVVAVGCAWTYLNHNERLRHALRGMAQRADEPCAEDPYLRRLAVKNRGGSDLIDLRGVDRIDAADHYLSFQCDGREHLVRGSLSALEAQLDPAQFVRIHRSTIVRIDAVTAVSARRAGYYIAQLRDGSRTKVGRSYGAEVRTRLRNNKF